MLQKLYSFTSNYVTVGVGNLQKQNVIGLLHIKFCFITVPKSESGYRNWGLKSIDIDGIYQFTRRLRSPV